MAYYEKALLYAYPHLDEISNQIDDLVLKRALGSFSDYSPCEEQAQIIIEMAYQKESLLSLKEDLNRILKKFSEGELIYFEYKYFKRKPKEYYINFNTTSRAYFRKQLKLIEKFKNLLKSECMDEKWFYDTFSNCEFMMRLVERVSDYERSGRIVKTKLKFVSKNLLKKSA